MATNLDLVLRLTNLVGYGWGDVNSNLASPDGGAPGAYYFCHDAFGPRVLQYVRNFNGSDITMGETMKYLSDADTDHSLSASALASGTTTAAVLDSGSTPTTFTADKLAGMICNVNNNSDSAGAAPEGESSIVAVNSTTVITMETSYPFSVAIAVDDTLELISTYQVEDCDAGNESWIVAGVVLGRDGIGNTNYGWIQREGNVSALTDGATITIGNDLVTAANVLKDGGVGVGALVCGIALSNGVSDQASKTIPTLLRLISFTNPGTA